MKLGVVGLPNVGKSTLFNAITKAGAESANYPFCTIEPNVGVVDVYDERLIQPFTAALPGRCTYVQNKKGILHHERLDRNTD